MCKSHSSKRAHVCVSCQKSSSPLSSFFLRHCSRGVTGSAASAAVPLPRHAGKTLRTPRGAWDRAGGPDHAATPPPLPVDPPPSPRPSDVTGVDESARHLYNVWQSPTGGRRGSRHCIITPLVFVVVRGESCCRGARGVRARGRRPRRRSLLRRSIERRGARVDDDGGRDGRKGFGVARCRLPDLLLLLLLLLLLRGRHGRVGIVDAATGRHLGTRRRAVVGVTRGRTRGGRGVRRGCSGACPAVVRWDARAHRDGS